MTLFSDRRIDLSSARLAALGLISMFTTVPAAAAHLEFSWYEAKVHNTYGGVGSPGVGDHMAGETERWTSVEGALASAEYLNGGTAYAGVEVHPIDPFALHYLTSAGAQGYLSYNFWLDGADPDALIPVRFQASGSVTSNGPYASGEALLRFRSVAVYEGEGSIWQQWNVVGSGGTDADPGIEMLVAFFDVDQIFYLKPSITYNIEMLASAGATTAGQDNSRAHATVDPVFTILGGFASDYSLVGVPGGATGAVPEPASWMMMIAGFGLLGAALRRRDISVKFGIAHRASGACSLSGMAARGRL